LNHEIFGILGLIAITIPTVFIYFDNKKGKQSYPSVEDEKK
jgi:hypothetical protein